MNPKIPFTPVRPRRRCSHALLSTMFKACGFVLVDDNDNKLITLALTLNCMTVLFSDDRHHSVDGHFSPHCAANNCQHAHLLLLRQHAEVRKADIIPRSLISQVVRFFISSNFVCLV